MAHNFRGTRISPTTRWYILKPSDSSYGGKRGHYIYPTYTDEEKARIATRAAEMGVINTLMFFRKELVDRPLKESSVRSYLGNKIQKRAGRSKYGKDMKITKLDSEKRGPPLLLDKELDSQVQEYVKVLRENGGVVNSAIVMEVAEGIIYHESRQQFAKTKWWAHCL